MKCVGDAVSLFYSEVKNVEMSDMGFLVIHTDTFTAYVTPLVIQVRHASKKYNMFCDEPLFSIGMMPTSAAGTKARRLLSIIINRFKSL